MGMTLVELAMLAASASDRVCRTRVDVSSHSQTPVPLLTLGSGARQLCRMLIRILCGSNADCVGQLVESLEEKCLCRVQLFQRCFLFRGVEVTRANLGFRRIPRVTYPVELKQVS